jgi:putative copper export protein
MIDGLWLALRAASFIVFLQATGSVLFLALCGGALAAAATQALRAAALRVTLIALALIVLQGLYEPVHLAGEWQGASDPALRRLALGSAGGVVLWLRFTGLGTLALALWRAHPALALPAALVALGSFLVSGHTLVDAHRVILLPLLALHVSVGAFWLGSLACLRRLLGCADRGALTATLERFSRRALWLVPLLALAGVLLAVTLLPDLGALRRPYGLLLCTKAALFLVLLSLAGFNRLKLSPALARAESAALSTLRRTLTAEQVLLALVLAVTAAMTGFYSPAAS